MIPQQRSVASGFPRVKLVLLLLSLGIAVYIVGHFVEVAGAPRHGGSCPPCSCDCSTENCNQVEPVMREESDKNSLDLLIEELKLQEAAAEESQQRSDSALLEAKKFASQYQKEAEKCNAGMETCEEAREKSEAALSAEKKISAMWERRARQFGWRGSEGKTSLLSRLGLADLNGGEQEESAFFMRRK